MKTPRARSVLSRAIALTTLSSFVIASCGGRTGAPITTHGNASPLADQVLVQTKDLPPGLDLRVSTGQRGAPAFDHATLAPATKLDDATATQLLTRATPITADAVDKQAFALRPNSQPPPRTGKTIKGAFPPPASSLLPPAATDANKALSVLRYMPEGAVPLAPQLSITFSQPMVAVTSQGDAAATQPATLTPTPKGRWRWIGTRTLVFDPDVRFPQATSYSVEVPAGTKSALGNALPTGVKFAFETPAPTIVSSSPSGYEPQHLDAPMFVLFDQQIDPAAVLASIHVTANGVARELRLLDAAEIAKTKQLAALVDATKKAEQDGRWLAFRATEPFPSDAAVHVEVAAGTPSREGPNKTKTAQSFDFHTFPPLKITEAKCGWQPNDCHPGTPFNISFNNSLDADKFDDAQVAITPAIPGVKIVQAGNNISIVGLTAPRTRYKVALSAGLRDEFAQTLGTDTTKTFAVGDAQPTFFGPDGIVVLDPAAKTPTLDFFSVNYDHLKVSLYAVTPADFDAFGLYLGEQWNHDHPAQLPGKRVFDGLVKTTAGGNALVESHVELAAALGKSGLGHAIVVVEPSPWHETYPAPRLISWVQSTKLAVDAYVDGDNLIAFTTELNTGKPAAGVALEIRPYGIKGTSDANGMATLPLAATTPKGTDMLVARRGDDVAFVAGERSYGNDDGRWSKHAAGGQVAWYVTDDRQMYKPGEDVSLKGWLRMLSAAKGGDIGGLAGVVTAVDYKVTDSRGNQIGAGTAAVSGVGGFDTTFTLPKTPNLGYASVQLTTQGRLHSSFTHNFQIQEFRRPEFAVTTAASQGPFLVGGSGDVTVNAKYYAGGPLPGAPVNWSVSAAQTNFTPPNRDDYVFGSWVPWWGMSDFGDDGNSRYRAPRSWSLADKTDATGAHTLHLDFLSANPAMPMAVTTYASVTDVNRQAWASSTSLIVHPSALYVGLQTKKPFVDKGTPFALDVIGVDLDGKAAPGAKIEVKAVRTDWTFKHGKYVSEELDPQTCAVVAAEQPVPCTFATKQGGTYQVTATIVDAKGRPNQTKLEFWVSGGEQPPARDVAQEKVQLIPDKKDYAGGDVAELLVQAPFYPAEGVVSWRRSGIVKTERITLTGATTTIHVPITDAMVPNMFVQVDLVGMAARSDDKGDPDPKLPKRPAYAVGAIDLSIPPKQRTLAVKVAPSAAKVAPGESATLAIEVADAQGRPVANAETAVIVVDEAILALTGYQFVNPISTFYGERGTDARDFYLHGYVKLAKPDAGLLALGNANARPTDAPMMLDMVAASPAAAPGGPPPPAPPPPPDKDADGIIDGTDVTKNAPPSQPNTPIAIRSNFNPLAAFAPSVMTGADGKATVHIKVPDNLTRYRIVAIAVAGDKQFGKGESALTARLPLMVRPSPPRFLNFGDTFKLPVVVQNQTDAPMTVRLAMRATNATITDGAGREVTVPPNDRVEVQFPAAAEMAGTARFQIVGSSGAMSDAAELALPVWTPATTEAFATYGVIDDGTVKQPVSLPGQVVKQFGGLEVTTSSTNLQALTDAMLYLVHYPFECAEQRSSRILAIAALRDVLAAFQTKDMPTPAAMNASTAVDIEHLTQMQDSDGGFGFWDRGGETWPYLTVYVTNALVHARLKGYTVPNDMLARASEYLKNIEAHYPAFYSQEVRWAISAYALYTRKLMGDLDIGKGLGILHDAGGADKLGLETDGWLLGTFAGNPVAADARKAIVRTALNRVSETAGAANFTTSYGDGNYLLLSSDRRVDGVMLESLIQEDPKLDLIPKLVTGLLAHRKAGRWENTQEDAFILLALDLYFQTYEKVTPDFVARVWLGKDYAGDHTFKGRSTDYADIDVPMRDVAAHDKQDLTIQKDGKGRLYYRVGMTYAPADLKLAAADYGFVVERRYEGADDPADVTRAADGTWHIKAGTRVRVRITMVNDNRRYHVALVDPLPAGLEIMNPELAVTGPIPTDPNAQRARGAYWWWYGPWYEHQNMRDERVEAFASLLWEGVHAYDYVARATTPGNFVVPPPKAEEMYMPETFGRGASDRVIVE